MIRRSRHASAEELASLQVGELRVRKAARIESHVATCDHCTRIRHQLDQMPAILASAHYPPMPESVTVRIEAMLSVESRQRLAAQPATEQGRRDLPTGHRRRASGQGWHLPHLSPGATRLVAAGGALAIVAAGGYEIASHVGSGVTASSSARSAAVPGQVQQLSEGPVITYGGPAAQHTIRAVQSGANFVEASLRTQATAAVHAAQARVASNAQPTFEAPGAPRAQGNSSAGSAAAGSGAAGRLSGCINLIAAARRVLLVDIAQFEHRPATLIVIAATATSPAEAWVVGSSCSATGRDVLAHAVLGRL